MISLERRLKAFGLIDEGNRLTPEAWQTFGPLLGPPSDYEQLTQQLLEIVQSQAGTDEPDHP